MPLGIERRYRRVTTVLREQDEAEADRIAEVLRSEGWAHANRSFVIRAALVCLSDSLRGKTPDEVLRFFVERRARRSARPCASHQPASAV